MFIAKKYFEQTLKKMFFFAKTNKQSNHCFLIFKLNKDMYPNRLRIRQHPTKGFYGKSSAGEKQDRFLSKYGING